MREHLRHTAGVPSVSYSQLQSYRTCPRRYEFAFVKKLAQPMTPENAFGVSMHSCLAKWGRREIENWKLKIENDDRHTLQSALFEERLSPTTYHLPPTTLLEFWHQSFVTSGYPTKAAADFDRARGERLLEKFYEWWEREPRRVVAVEKGFRIEVDGLSGLSGSSGLSITGRFDRVEEGIDGTIRIIDFKTGGLRVQAEVDQDLQLSLYAVAAMEVFGSRSPKLSMLFLVEEDVTEISTERSEKELRDALTTIRLFSERIASKDYTPTPSREKCRRCPFRRVCDAAASSHIG